MIRILLAVLLALPLWLAGACTPAFRSAESRLEDELAGLPGVVEAEVETTQEDEDYYVTSARVQMVEHPSADQLAKAAVALERTDVHLDHWQVRLDRVGDQPSGLTGESGRKPAVPARTRAERLLAALEVVPEGVDVEVGMGDHMSVATVDAVVAPDAPAIRRMYVATRDLAPGGVWIGQGRWVMRVNEHRRFLEMWDRFSSTDLLPEGVELVGLNVLVGEGDNGFDELDVAITLHVDGDDSPLAERNRRRLWRFLTDRLHAVETWTDEPVTAATGRTEPLPIPEPDEWIFSVDTDDEDLNGLNLVYLDDSDLAGAYEPPPDGNVDWADRQAERWTRLAIEDLVRRLCVPSPTNVHTIWCERRAAVE